MNHATPLPPQAELEPTPQSTPTDTAASALVALTVSGTPERPDAASDPTSATEYFISPEDGVWLIKDRLDRTIKTNIEPGFFTKTETGHGQPVVNLPPSALDELPEDTYYLEVDDNAHYEKVELKVFSPDTSSTDRYFRISHIYDKGNTPKRSEFRTDRTAPHLGRIEDELLGSGFLMSFGALSQPKEQTAPLLNALKSDGAAPTPLTLQKKLQDEWGIRTKLVTESDPKTGQTSVDAFVEAFGEGSYPLGVGGVFEFYTHDAVDDDHMPGVMTGGQGMLDLLATPAKSVSDRFSKQLKANSGPYSYGEYAESKWVHLIPTASLLDSITSDTRALYEKIVDTGVARVPQDFKKLEESFADLLRHAGMSYEEGKFTVTILEGFAAAGKKSGLESQAKNVVALMEKYEVYLQTGESPSDQPRTIGDRVNKRRNRAN